jgi:transposase InsO family protein
MSKATRRRYTAEFKAEAVRLVKQQGYGVAEAARALGINRSLLDRWLARERDRQVVGWAMADHLRTDLVRAALDMAVGRRRPAPGLLHHSDRGSQYASQAYRKTREQHQMEASMSRKGNGWDNAVMERFFGSLKSEGLADQRDLNRDQARQDIVQYIEMHYNSNRLPLCYSCSNP